MAEVGLFYQALNLLQAAGWLAGPLLITALLLFYLLGSRSALLSKPALEALKRGQDVEVFELRFWSDIQAQLQRSSLFAQDTRRQAFEEIYVYSKHQLKKHRGLINCLVAIAPLLGLLGTVVGMIETFDSLGDGALHSQGGGVAAGISQAMLTTEMGLIISIPGLLFGRALSKRESWMLREIKLLESQLLEVKAPISRVGL